MDGLEWIAVLSGTLFRFFAWTFLRIFPGHFQAYYFMPITFIPSTVAFYLLYQRQESSLSSSKDKKAITQGEALSDPTAVASTGTSDDVAKSEDTTDTDPTTSAHDENEKVKAEDAGDGEKNKVIEKASGIGSDLVKELDESDSVPMLAVKGWISLLGPFLLSLPLPLPPRRKSNSKNVRHSRPKRLLTLLPFLVNLSLLLSSLDLFLSPHMSLIPSIPFLPSSFPIFGSGKDSVMEARGLSFVRVGAVGPTDVKIIGRVPPVMVENPVGVVPEEQGEEADGSVVEKKEEQKEMLETGARVLYRMSRPVGNWILGPLLAPKGDDGFDGDDWVAVARLEGLAPGIEYEYRLTLPATPNVHHPYFPHSQFFTTFPDPSLSSSLASPPPASPNAPPHIPGVPSSGSISSHHSASHFKFASTSCIKQGFPYPWKSMLSFGMGWGRDPLEVKGARTFEEVAKREGVDFLMFMGDFIYADTPYNPGPNTKAYHRLYRQMFASKDWRGIYEKMPIFHIYDDHEISNNYDGGGNDAIFNVSNVAYTNYLGKANPDGPRPDVNYYDFRYGDAAFFVWDTRKYRSPNLMKDNYRKNKSGNETNSDDEEEDVGFKSMLGEQQKVDFYKWLGKVNNTVTWKFVVSSVPFTTMWAGYDGSTDTWTAFQSERQELLDVMEWVPNVIVMSGDRHEFGAIALRDAVLEFSTSPLNQFSLPIRTFSQSHGLGASGEEKVIEYLPDGQNKFTTFEVDTRIQNKPELKVRVYIDGAEKWAMDIEGQMVKQPTLALGSLRDSLFEIFNFLPRKWFS